MTAEDFDRTPRAFQRRALFKPFTVELVSGNRFQVDHPEALVLRDGVAALLPTAAFPCCSITKELAKCLENRRSSHQANDGDRRATAL